MTYNSSRKQSAMKYMKTLKQILFRVRPEDYQRYEKCAAEIGYSSMRQFFLDAIEEKIARREEHSNENYIKQE